LKQEQEAAAAFNHYREMIDNAIEGSEATEETKDSAQPVNSDEEREDD
jgi:hypothetical protein